MPFLQTLVQSHNLGILIMIHISDMYYSYIFLLFGIEYLCLIKYAFPWRTHYYIVLNTYQHQFYKIRLLTILQIVEHAILWQLLYNTMDPPTSCIQTVTVFLSFIKLSQILHFLIFVLSDFLRRQTIFYVLILYLLNNLLWVLLIGK